MLDILKPTEKCLNLAQALDKKLVVTLGINLRQQIVLNADWFSQLSEVFASAKVFLRICWLKAIAGAWCTSVRMREDIILPCIFGCTDARDELTHYLQCTVLWLFASENLGHETHFDIAHRLCLVSPTTARLRALAFVHTLYHTCKNDRGCFNGGGNVLSANVVQGFASQHCRHVVHLVQ